MAEHTAASEGALIAQSTVAQILRGLATTELSRTALTYYREGSRESVWSVGRLLTAVQNAQARLRDIAGIAMGDRVMLQSANCPEFVVASLAVMAMGAIVVPVAPDESAGRTAYIVSHSQPTALLFDEASVLAHAAHEEILETPRHSLQDLCKNHDRDHDATRLQQWSPRISHSSPATLLYTSGTTGRPKGVTLSHHNLAVNAEALVRVHGLRETSTHVCVLPLHHTNAFEFSMISTWYAKGHLILNNSYPFFDIQRIINDEQADVISLTPQIIRMWLRRPIHASNVPSLRYAVSAAAPLPSALARAFHETTGLRIHQGYGLTESTNFATAIEHGISDEDYERVMHGDAVPSVGTEVFGAHCATVDADGRQLPEGVEGEIIIRGPGVMSGYWRDEKATAQVLGSGYLRTGDQGYWRVHGGKRYFFVTGRTKELIIRAGVNVSPREVEDELGLSNDHAVVGFAHEAAGEEIGLYVKGPLSAAQLGSLEERLTQIPFSRRPKVVLCGRDDVPRTATGKVRRGLIAERFAQYGSVTLTGNAVFSIEAEGQDLEGTWLTFYRTRTRSGKRY